MTFVTSPTPFHPSPDGRPAARTPWYVHHQSLAGGAAKAGARYRGGEGRFITIAGAMMSDHDSAGAVLECPDIDALDDEDKARFLTTFLGYSRGNSSALHFVHASGDGQAPAYVFDDESGMVYILD
jgi:hypothetical protein